MGEPITMEQALEELRTLDPAVQQDALIILAEYDDPMVAETMLEVLPKIDTSQPGGGYAAAQIAAELAGRGERRAVEPIIALFDRNLDKSGDDHQLERVACDAFKTLQATEALPFLRQSLLSKRWAYHEDDVADALATIGGPNEESLLLEGVASRRTGLRIASLRALRIAGTEKAIPALEKATKSSNDEIAVAALGTLCVLKSDEANEILERAFATATDYALKGDLIRLVRELREPDLSDRLLPLFADPEWEPLRFEILEILVDRKHPRAAEGLQNVIDSNIPSPWPKARAAALLLSLKYNDEIVGQLLHVLATQKYEAERDTNFHGVNEAGGTVITVLVAQTADHPTRRLELALLLDDLRRGRIETFGRGSHLAGDAVAQIVGSRFYSAFDSWVTEYRAQHNLDEVISPAAAAEQPSPSTNEEEKPERKPWWKVW